MGKLMAKVVFYGDGIPEDLQLEASLTDNGKDENGKFMIDLRMGPGHALLNNEPSVYTNIFNDVVGTLGVIARSIKEDGSYESVFTLKKSEYKEYVEKVLGKSVG
jgi:phosphomevalonate kinase